MTTPTLCPTCKGDPADGDGYHAADCPERPRTGEGAPTLITIPRDSLQSAYELLMDTWVGQPCDRGCGCVLHELRGLLGIEETDEDYTAPAEVSA